MFALKNFSKPFLIKCDALGVSREAVLMQEGQPFTYVSHALKGKALDLSTYEKELLTLIYAVKKCRPYILGSVFIVKTDQQSLKFLLEPNFSQQKWISKLLGYDFTIKYNKGMQNKVTNVLSRQPKKEGEVSLADITILDPMWMQGLMSAYYKINLELAELC